MSVLSELVKYPRLAVELRSYLKNTITSEQCKTVISQRLRDREKNFLSLIETGIYQNSNSPYLQLLKFAGCELGDIKASVTKDGIETTLQHLLDNGVYIGWEEFKGKREIIRGSSHFQFAEKDFNNPFSSSFYQMKSSGSRSAGTRTNFDLTHKAQMAYYTPIMLDAENATDFPMVLWLAEFPSEAGVGALIQQAKIGNPAIKWFSPVKPEIVRASVKDKLATNFIIFTGRIWGTNLVKPQHVSLENACEIVLYVAKIKKDKGGCNVTCFVTQAVKMCHAAIEKGIDFHGVHFFVAGEPLSEAKLKQITATGALVTPRYYISEFGTIGFGCPNPAHVDEIHLFHDSITTIQRQRPVEHTDITVNAFVFTDLLLTSPKIILNVECDDYGVIENRNCGCNYEKLGFSRHVSHIRSYAKLTGSGMTIVGSDLVHILEEILPVKYGGSAADYQIIEEEDEKGQTHLNLIISPAVGNIDERGAIETILSELRHDVHGGKLAAGFWSQMNTLRVERRYPLSSRGKVLTLHLLPHKK